VDVLSADSATGISVSNCVLGKIGIGPPAGTVSFRNVTLVSNARSPVNRGEPTFDHCILTGGAAYLFQIDPVVKSLQIRSSVISSRGAFATIEKSGVQKAHVEKPEDFEPNGITATGCTFEKPLFADEENDDYRLAPDSPGKGAGLGGRDPGAQLGADGWPSP
jgi:hypothetical protein